jgi:hypothetical protein
MNTRTLVTRAAVVAAAAGILGGAAATSASAAVTPASRGTVTSVTHIHNRYDSGGNGNWAYDTFSRTLTVSYLGKVTPAQIAADPALAATPYEFNAQVSDTGTFKDIPGAFTPNQGGRNLGRVLKPGQVTGTMTGYGQWSVFYASAKDARGLAPRQLNGTALNALYPSATWPELAFPAGTAFSGVNEASYGYDYTVPAATVTRITYKWVNGHKVPVKHVRVLRAQHWSDTALNGDGQLQHDGNITGR